MTKLTDAPEVLPEVSVKPKTVKQKNIEPVKYYRVNPNKFPKQETKGWILGKPKDVL